MFVSGWVERPGVYPLSPDPRLTTHDVISLAGGLDKSVRKPKTYQAVFMDKTTPAAVTVRSVEWHRRLEELGIDVSKSNSVDVKGHE
jgi:protein involved in polysaccharide export with SLBB domain